MGTSTNADGLPFYYALKEAYSSNKKLRISLKNSSPFSSSFLNSSIGAFMDEFGASALKKTLVICDYKPTELERILDYTKSYSKLLK